MAEPSPQSTTKRASDARPAVQANVAVDPDATYVKSYLCVRVQPGIEPIQLADGSWTLRRAAAAGGGDGELDAIALAQDELALQALLAANRAQRIERFAGGAFKRPDLAARHGLDRACIIRFAPGVDVVALNARLAAEFPALIERSELDSVGSIAGVPNDPSFNLQWDMHNTGQSGTADSDIDAPEAWDIHTGSASTIIAILDTGVQADHPDLVGKVLTGIDTYQAGSPDTTDNHGHGTHCSGIAAAQGNNSVGVAGVNWAARILPVRVTSTSSTNPTTNQTDVAEAVVWATDNNANAISMSLQFYSSENQNLKDALAYAYDAGTLPVAAAGNIPSSGAGHVAWPARYLKCMAIAATTNTDARWYSSSTNGSCDGPELDIAAPGAGVYNIWRLSSYSTQTGTSMATPHVAGLAALLMSRNPALTVAQVEQILRDTANDVNSATNPGFDNFLGYGRVNAHAAMLAAAPPCDADITGTGNTVDTDDLLLLLGSWGGCVNCAACPADIVVTCTVDTDDLLELLGSWGACP